ncbi:MAG: hypothetical protein V7631_1755 [Massilia sp.]
MTHSAPQGNEVAHYGDAFYQSQMDGSYRSARRFIEFLTSFYAPRTVVDLGCGRGTWLKAFREQGAELTVGLDGDWNNQANMVDPAILFEAVDLNQRIVLPGDVRFDLAVSLEVAEHLEASSAATFVQSLTDLSDVIMFGAAYTQQGGTNHVNEQPHTYWAQQFRNQGYVVFDLFRPLFWGAADVEYWYQQNTFLYVKEGHPLVEHLRRKGMPPLDNIAFMDCVHPILYRTKLAHANITADHILTYTKMLVEQHPRFAPQVLQIVANSLNR